MKMGATVQLKGFKEDGRSVTGKLQFDKEFVLHLKPKEEAATPPATSNVSATTVPDPIPCPKCGIGKVVKGKSAYGCSHWKTGCSFRFPFDEIRQRAAKRPLTKLLVWHILKGEK